MRELKFEKIEIQGAPQDTRKLLVTVLERPSDPKVGVTIKDMREVAPILNKVDPLGVDIQPASVRLEAAEWGVVKTRLAAFPWAIVDRGLIAWADYIEALEELEEGSA